MRCGLLAAVLLAGCQLTNPAVSRYEPSRLPVGELTLSTWLPAGLDSFRFDAGDRQLLADIGFNHIEWLQEVRVGDSTAEEVAMSFAGDAGLGSCVPADPVAAMQDRSAPADGHESYVVPGDTGEGALDVHGRRQPTITVVAVQDCIVTDRHESPSAPRDIAKPPGVSACQAASRQPAVAVAAVQESVAPGGHESIATPSDTVECRRGAGVCCRQPTVAILAVHDRAIVADRNEPIAAPNDAAEIGLGNAFLCFSPLDTVVAEHYGAAISDRDETPVAPGNTGQTVPIDSSCGATIRMRIGRQSG